MSFSFGPQQDQSPYKKIPHKQGLHEGICRTHVLGSASGAAVPERWDLLCSVDTRPGSEPLTSGWAPSRQLLVPGRPGSVHCSSTSSLSLASSWPWRAGRGEDENSNWAEKSL